MVGVTILVVHGFRIQGFIMLRISALRIVSNQIIAKIRRITFCCFATYYQELLRMTKYCLCSIHILVAPIVLRMPRIN
jgi:hypothetical protein